MQARRGIILDAAVVCDLRHALLRPFLSREAYGTQVFILPHDPEVSRDGEPQAPFLRPYLSRRVFPPLAYSIRAFTPPAESGNENEHKRESLHD